MSDARKLLHVETIRVRWGDMDSLAHLNNACYFTYLESTRVGWLDAIGGPTGAWWTLGYGPVIANASCEFLRPVVYPATLQVSMWGGPPGNSSFQSLYELRDAGSPEVLYATGAARVVWVDYRAGRSTRLPDTIRALLPAPVAG